VLRKAAIVVRALERHRGVVARAGDDPRATLAAMGGKEMAAMVGAIHAASELRVAVIVDGFISSVAALIAVRILPPSAECLFLSTVSPERGHRLCLGALRDAIGCPADGQSAAALDMGLRLGEGTGALLCIPILRAAAAVSSHMVTLKDALER
jgi:nicotinate-nucleotide--dimethylbenzimidazole phosphoribosyltransferase